MTQCFTRATRDTVQIAVDDKRFLLCHGLEARKSGRPSGLLSGLSSGLANHQISDRLEAWKSGSLACKDVQKTSLMWWPRFGSPMAGMRQPMAPCIRTYFTASEVEIGLLPAGFKRDSFAGGLQVDQRKDAQLQKWVVVHGEQSDRHRSQFLTSSRYCTIRIIPRVGVPFSFF
jgi:hypothetical protein